MVDDGTLYQVRERDEFVEAAITLVTNGEYFSSGSSGGGFEVKQVGNIFGTLCRERHFGTAHSRCWSQLREQLVELLFITSLSERLGCQACFINESITATNRTANAKDQGNIVQITLQPRV
jgi:hypothetical protein